MVGEGFHSKGSLVSVLGVTGGAHWMLCSHIWHCWCWKRELFLERGCSCPCKQVSRIPGLYPLEAAQWDTQKFLWTTYIYTNTYKHLITKKQKAWVWIREGRSIWEDLEVEKGGGNIIEIQSQKKKKPQKLLWKKINASKKILPNAHCVRTHCTSWFYPTNMWITNAILLLSQSPLNRPISSPFWWVFFFYLFIKAQTAEGTR